MPQPARQAPRFERPPLRPDEIAELPNLLPVLISMRLKPDEARVRLLDLRDAEGPAHPPLWRC